MSSWIWTKARDGAESVEGKSKCMYHEAKKTGFVAAAHVPYCGEARKRKTAKRSDHLGLN